MPALPTNKPVADLKKEVSNLLDRIIDYIGKAEESDQKELDHRTREDEDEVELPFAEERDRLKPALKPLRAALARIKAAPLTEKSFQEITNTFSEWQETFNDCTTS